MCVYTCIQFCVCECMWGGDKHLSPEAAFRFPLTSSVKSAQSLHCHLPATRERPALHTDKLICLEVSARTHTHTLKDTYTNMPVAHAEAFTYMVFPKGLPLSPKNELKQNHCGGHLFLFAGERKRFLLNSYQNWSVIVYEKDGAQLPAEFFNPNHIIK